MSFSLVRVRLKTTGRPSADIAGAVLKLDDVISRAQERFDQRHRIRVQRRLEALQRRVPLEELQPVPARTGKTQLLRANSGKIFLKLILLSRGIRYAEAERGGCDDTPTYLGFP